MFTSRYGERNNIVGVAIRQRRKEQKISQRELSERLFEYGFDIDKNGIQRIESGERFVIDIELEALASYFGCTISELIVESKTHNRKEG